MAYGVRQVPQNIMSVEFKLFDIMTLKQFGISVALLIICFFIFIGLSAFSPWNIVVPVFIILIGAVVIFVPFNGEPFQEFVSNFMEAMISPQRRVWHKKGMVLKSAAEKARIYRFGEDTGQKLSTFEVDTNKFEEVNAFDEAESKFMSNAPVVENKVNTSQNILPRQNDGTVIANHNLKKTIVLDNSQIKPPIQTNNQVHLPVVNNQTGQIQSNHAQNLHSEYNNQSVIQNPVANSPQPTPINHSQQIPPQETIIKSSNPFEDLTIKNFLFGNVEDYSSKPIRNAIIVISQEGKQLEVLSSNDIGDFKTAYEYPAGDYELLVKQEDYSFDVVRVKHDPVDPAPITIHPRKPVVPQEELEANFNQNSDPDIFDGNYDSSVFNIGHDYVDMQISPKQEEIKREDIEPITINQAQDDIDISNISIPVSGSKKTGMDNANYVAVANNMFDQANSYKTAVDPTTEFISDPKYLSKDTTSLAAQSNQADNVITTSQQPGNSNSSNVNIQFYNYLALPDANVPFEQNLINVPNTLNGVLVNNQGYGMQGILCSIYDQSNNLVTSMYTDNLGKYYSYSPVQNGFYRIIFSNQGNVIVGFEVPLNGNIIKPKFISFR